MNRFKASVKNRSVQTALFLLLLCSHLAAVAQQHYAVRGLVRDSLGVPIPYANVKLISGKDTLSSTTDTLGAYGFRQLKPGSLQLLVRSIGYAPASMEYLRKGTSGEELLPVMVLRPAANALKEVKIRGIVPVRIRKDTIEYDAAAYPVHEHDRVAELLRQLPGVQLDQDGQVTTAGKSLTRIRVNGKDFFTGDVAKFIASLPAGIVDKIQLIDDYGDEANFTGIRKGEPQKLLNLVLKQGIHAGNFGNAVLSAGTADRYGAVLDGNRWNGDHQLNLNAGAGNTGTGAGLNTLANAGIGYRDKIKEHLVLGGGYTYGYNRTLLEQQTYTITVNPLGTLYNQAGLAQNSKNNTHSIDLSAQSEAGENFFQASFRAALQRTASGTWKTAHQSGVVLQDLLTGSMAQQRTPRLDGSAVLARKLNSRGRTLSLNLSSATGKTVNADRQDNRISYFDQQSGLLLKDSVLNQELDMRNRQLNLNATVAFTEPLGRPDSVKGRNLDLSYTWSVSHTRNVLESSVYDASGRAFRVDSLSNAYQSSFYKQMLSVNYRYFNRKLNYTAGINAQPNLLTGSYEGREERVRRRSLNVSPVLQVGYRPSGTQSYTLYYSGNSQVPDFSQLQPVRDTRDLQHVIVGNPELKAAFSHQLNLNYNQVSPGSGNTLQLTLRAVKVQDQVTTSTLLIRDTLNSLKQETRYLNTSGNYTLGANYYWTKPFGQRRYTFELRGGMGYSQQVSFTEDEKNLGRGLNLNQAAGLRMNRKWLMLNGTAAYSYRSQQYTLPGSFPNTVSSWLFNADGRVFLNKYLVIGTAAVKALSKGYNLPGNSPFLLNGYIEQTFFKSKSAILRLEGKDLFNQGTNLSRSVSGSSVTESKANQLTRFFLVTLTWRVDHFGNR